MILDLAYISVAAICAIVAFQHLLVAIRIDGRRSQALISVAAIGIILDSIVARRCYSCSTPEEFLQLMPLGALAICTTMVSLAWYLDLQTRAARRWVVLAITGAGALVVVLDFAVGIAYSEITSLRTVHLPWNESITLASGPSSPLRFVGDLTNFGFLLFLIDTGVRSRRARGRNTSRLIWAGVTLYSVGMLTIIPVDLGLFNFPSMHTFAFLLIVLVLGWDTTLELARMAELSDEVSANERRWKLFLERAQLLVARLDPSGRVTEVNPHYLSVTGFKASERVGLHFRDFIAKGEVSEAEALFERALSGDVQSESDYPLQTKGGDTRTVQWRTVLLRDAEGEVEGLLCVGADITEQERAIHERDRLLAELRQTVSEIETLRGRLEEDNLTLQEEVELQHFSSDLVGRSDAMLYVLSRIDHVAGSDASVLIQGESGVGKELVARTIHKRSERSARAFRAVNCAALSPTLVESELFGHEKGAFTGADRARRGRFELADGGTLLLDEIGDLPLEVQPKLLRVLENGEFERVGGSEILHADVRVIAATNRDLKEMVNARQFREDLFYRLDVYPITIPPLRDRREDIPQLVQHFARTIATRRGRNIEEIAPDLMRSAESYDWPGNIRELQNVIERAVLTSHDGCLRLADPLSSEEAKSKNGHADRNDDLLGRPSGSRTVGVLTMQEVEREHIQYVLEYCRGQIAGSGGAAERLGLHPNTLRSRMKKLGIPSSASQYTSH